jgi:hypothetical protein
MRTPKLVGALSVAGAILLASYAPAQVAPSHLFPQLRNQTPKTGAPSKCDGAAGTAAGAMAGTGMGRRSACCWRPDRGRRLRLYAASLVVNDLAHVVGQLALM